MSASVIATSGTIFLANTWGEPDMTGGRGAEFGKASPIGLFLILALLIAVVLLVRSMNRRLRNLPTSFDDLEGGASGDSGTLGSSGTPDDNAPGTAVLPGAQADGGAATMVKDAEDGVDLQK